MFISYRKALLNISKEISKGDVVLFHNKLKIAEFKRMLVRQGKRPHEVKCIVVTSPKGIQAVRNNLVNRRVFVPFII